MIACFVYQHSNYESSCMLYMNAHHFGCLEHRRFCAFTRAHITLCSKLKLPEYSRVPVQVGTHSREKKNLARRACNHIYIIGVLI